VGGAPNYVTIAHVGIMDHGSISMSINKAHYTNAGIKENGTFSVNIPSVEMVVQTDYFGLVSGKRVDKARLVQTFYGELQTAPMIEQCLINMECRLLQTVDFPRHDVFVGQVAATYCDESVLTDGAPFDQAHGVVDFERVRPILFVMNDRSYWKLGERLGQAWSIGKELIK
jgi:flavin reductase (DIM6/NTAB) family NADH-FMN oxidoreductase RutF